MKSKLRIDIFGKIFIYTILVYNLFIKLFISLDIVPYSANYLNDIFLGCTTIFGLVQIFKLYKDNKVDKQFSIIIISSLILVLFCLLSAIIGHTKILLFICHVRNNYRVFLFLILSYIFLDKKDIKKILDSSFYILILHALIATFQLFNYYNTYQVFYFQDHINGLFGTTKGYNTYSIIITLSITIYFVFKYLFENKSKYKMIISLILCGWITGISEFKFVYVFMVLLMAMIIIFSIKIVSVKKLISTVLAIFLTCMFSFASLQFFYPQFKNFFLDFNQFKNYVSDVSYGSETRKEINIGSNEDNDTNSGSNNSTNVDKASDENNNGINNNSVDSSNTPNESNSNNQINQPMAIPGLNRISTFNIIPKYFFNESLNYFVGIGAGNAEYSQNNLLCSNFYKLYGNIDYIRFSSSILLLETGFLGLSLYAGQFIVLAIIYLYKIVKYYNNKMLYKNNYLLFVSLFFCGISLIMIVYDAALRSEAAYFYGFILSCGLITSKEKRVSNDKE